MSGVDWSAVPTSITVPQEGESELRFSARDDYVSALMNQGVISSEVDLLQDLRLVAEVQQQWFKKRMQVGCRFAKVMAGDPAGFGWYRFAVPGTRPDDWLAANLEDRLEDSIADSSIHALSMIFPEVVEDSQLTDLIRYFHAFERTHIEEVVEKGEEDPDLVHLGLRIEIVESVFSFPLCLGPFEVFPLTRRSPFTELALPTSPKSHPTRPNVEPDPSAVHLAAVQVPVSKLGDDAWSKLWAGTEQLKRKVLGGKQPGARARVTVSLPRALWEGESS